MHDPDHWRRRADEARSVAVQMTGVESKNAVLEIAAEYDKLCRRVEDRAKTTWRKRERCCCAAGQNRLADLDWLSPSPGLIKKHNGLKDGQQRGINAASSGI
jgi:hypothetical protein